MSGFTTIREALERAGISYSTVGWASPGGYCPHCQMADGAHIEDECEIAMALVALDGLEEQLQAERERAERLLDAQGVHALKEQLEAGVVVVDLLLSQMSRGTGGVRDESWYAARDVAENWLPARRSNPAKEPS